MRLIPRPFCACCLKYKMAIPRKRQRRVPLSNLSIPLARLVRWKQGCCNDYSLRSQTIGPVAAYLHKPLRRRRAGLLWSRLRDCESDLRGSSAAVYRSGRRCFTDRRFLDSDCRCRDAIFEARLAFMSPAHATLPLFLAVLGATLAMIEPGTWSIDAWVFGRKRIVPPDAQTGE